MMSSNYLLHRDLQIGDSPYRLLSEELGREKEVKEACLLIDRFRPGEGQEIAIQELLLRGYRQKDQGVLPEAGLGVLLRHPVSTMRILSSKDWVRTHPIGLQNRHALGLPK